MSEVNTAPTATEPAKNNAASEALAAAKAETNGKPKKPAKPAKAAEEKKEPEGPKVTLNPFAVKWIPDTIERKKIDKEASKGLQHRNQLQDLREGGAVEQYAEAIREAKAAGREDPFSLPGKRIRIVRDADAKANWLVDGFQRLGAYELTKTAEVPVEYVDGTYADALMLSLASNGENSVLARTKDDARRSVFALLDNPNLLAWALSQVKGKGGVHRVFADLCKTSTGTVTNALDVRGLKAKGDTLAAATKKKEPKKKPEGKPDAGLSGGVAPIAQPEVSEAQQKKIDAEAYERLGSYERVRLAKEAVACTKRLAALFALFATDENLSTDARKAMSAAGFPLGAGFDKEAAKEGKGFAPYYSILENWPFAGKMIEAWESVAEAAEPKSEGDEGGDESDE